MGFIITAALSSLKIFGWQKLLKLTYKVVRKDLHKWAARTDTQIDDEGFKALDELMGIVDAKKES